MLHAVAAAVALIGAVPADQDPQAATVARAMAQMATGHSEQALVTVEPAIAAYERRYAGERRQVFCGYSQVETIASLALATAAKRDAVALEPGWCDALFLKGFALSDLHRFVEAAPLLEHVAAMAPFHPQFLSELGYAYQQQRDWQRSYDAYQRARDAADFTGADRKAEERGRALRGMGYALIEQGEWDRAEALYRECLRLDPDDAKAKNELRYLQEQRQRPRA